MKKNTESSTGWQFDDVPPWRSTLLSWDPQQPRHLRQTRGCNTRAACPAWQATKAELDPHFTFETLGKSPSHAALWFLSCKSGCTSSARTIHPVNSLGQGVPFAMCLHSTQA